MSITHSPIFIVTILIYRDADGCTRSPSRGDLGKHYRHPADERAATPLSGERDIIPSKERRPCSLLDRSDPDPVVAIRAQCLAQIFANVGEHKGEKTELIVIQILS